MGIDNADSPVVNTTHGRVRGHVLKGLYDETYYCFEGIPYAAPPLGSLRFKATVSLTPWHGIRNCTVPKPKCLQLGSYTKVVEGSEDCLYLNIYVKQLNTTAPLPVMVYIHGGGHKTGDATRRAWSPDYFMHENVVFITIGYRLGVFGFLSFTDSALEVPGNAGLKDIVQALKWIKANCANFNGDSDNITLFGHSSGAVIVHLLNISPQSKGLYHKAILMAGYANEIHKIPNVNYRLAKALGYEGGKDDEQSIFNHINNANPARLTDFNFWTQTEVTQNYLVAFEPCIEPYATDTAILLDEPIKLQRTAWSNRIPIMLGTTSCESLSAISLFKTNEKLLEIYRRHQDYLLPHSLIENCDLGTQRLLAKQLVQIHFEGREISTENYECTLELVSYRFNYHSQHRAQLARLAYSSAPTYVYRFDFDSPDFNFYRLRFCGPDIRGASHVDELGYIFVIPATFKLDKDRAEYLTIRRMISTWYSFALNSHPNNSSLEPVVWRPLTRFEPPMCLNIGEKVKFIEWPEFSKCRMIDRLYEEAGIDLF